MRFRVHEGGGVRDLDVSVREVIVAGMTRRTLWHAYDTVVLPMIA